MRGKPLDINTLINKINNVDHRASVTYTDKTTGETRRHYRRAMDKGWMDLWRREWRYLWQELNAYLETNPDDKHAANIVRKLACRGSWYNEKGNLCVVYSNKLYLSKAEMPWLVEWVKQQAMNGIEQEYFD
jgi:hypothetical protein